MAIWSKETFTLEELNALSKHTLAEALDMRFTAIGENYLALQMPVGQRTHQPYGLLHGGASAALAETVGSVASWMCIDSDKQMCVGMEINCNHLRGKKSGMVTATATPLHLGARSHVWDIRITDEQGKLVCISRFTVAILRKKEVQG